MTVLKHSRGDSFKLMRKPTGEAGSVAEHVGEILRYSLMDARLTLRVQKLRPS